MAKEVNIAHKIQRLVQGASAQGSDQEQLVPKAAPPLKKAKIQSTLKCHIDLEF